MFGEESHTQLGTRVAGILMDRYRAALAVHKEERKAKSAKLESEGLQHTRKPSVRGAFAHQSSHPAGHVPDGAKTRHLLAFVCSPTLPSSSILAAMLATTSSQSQWAFARRGQRSSNKSLNSKSLWYNGT